MEWRRNGGMGHIGDIGIGLKGIVKRGVITNY